eukprot:gene5404-9217_t
MKEKLKERSNILKKNMFEDRLIRNEPTREELEIMNYKLYKKLDCLNNYEKNLDKVMFNNSLGNNKMMNKEEEKNKKKLKKNRYSDVFNSSSFDKKEKREINQNSERILDIPGIIDDFYLNILDWSKKNIISIGLTENLYLYNYLNSKSFKFTSLNSDYNSGYISSLKFEENGNFIGIGTSKGNIELWDIEKEKKIRNIKSKERSSNERILSLDWNDYILTSGGKNKILNHDVRMKNDLVSNLNFHSNEVCGLKWSNDKKYLCSGGSDNLCFIFDSKNIKNPLFQIKEHNSSIKSINWSNSLYGHTTNENILLTGGGLNDGKIKIWNITKLKNEQTISYSLNSQISSISSSNNEFITTSGFNNSTNHHSNQSLNGNQISIFKYKKKQIKNIFNLKGHTQRILHSVQSPVENEKIITASSDETIRIWNVFQKNTIKNSKNNSPLSIKDLNLR